MRCYLKEIVIFGTGGHSKVVYDAVRKQGLFKVVAFISLNEQIDSFLDVKHYPQSRLDELNFNAGVIAVGDNFKRAELSKHIRSLRNNFEFVTVVHPSSSIGSGVKLGVGTVVMGQVAINADSAVGEHCIVNTSSSVDHDCRLADYASIAPGAVLGGNVNVGLAAAVSIGAVVKHGCKIGDYSVLGAGATLLSDLESNVIAYGTPAKFVRTRQFGDKYL